ncbi:hypothetical protein Tco_1127552 [Tanacetum coccineum]
MDQVESIKTSKALKEIFLEFKDVSHDFIPDERCVWIDLVGLPLAYGLQRFIRSWVVVGEAACLRFCFHIVSDFDLSLLSLLIGRPILIDGGLIRVNPWKEGSRGLSVFPDEVDVRGVEVCLVSPLKKARFVMIRSCIMMGVLGFAWKCIWTDDASEILGVHSQGDCAL